MIEIDLDKTLENEATGYIKIEKLIKIEAGAVYNDGGNVTVNVYGKEQAKKSPEGLQQEATKSEVAALEKEDEEVLVGDISDRVRFMLVVWESVAGYALLRSE